MSASLYMRSLGRSIGYYPKLTEIFGSVTASIFFSNMFYWQPKAKSELGVYKTADEIKTETGLSVQEQRTARKKLKDLGVLVETNKRFEHRLYFLIDESKFDELWEATFNQQRAKIDNENQECDSQHSRGCNSTSPSVGSNIRGVDNQHSTYSNTDDYLHTTTQSSAQARETSEKNQNPPAAKKPEPQPKRTKYTEGFEQFWFAYTHAPDGYTARTGGKPKAFEYWQKQHLESITAELVEKVNDFWAHDDSWHNGYQPFAQKWLNEKRYEDEPQRPMNQHNQSSAPRKSYWQEQQDGYEAMRAWGRGETTEASKIIEGVFHATK